MRGLTSKNDTISTNI